MTSRETAKGRGPTLIGLSEGACALVQGMIYNGMEAARAMFDLAGAAQLRELN
jgi:hypothetical protein